MRGEHTQRRTGYNSTSGLSPHARGTSLQMTLADELERFIPACAGNIRQHHTPCHSHTVYHRMRGEHALYPRTQRRGIGLSPHARGTFIKCLYFANKNRFIPACAGNIQWDLLRHGRETVYPRMRGEHFSSPAPLCMASGLSPHARGTFIASVTRLMVIRFIPACAGNIRTQFCVFHTTSVYPRMRGEHLRLFGRIFRLNRFIPACAGNIRPRLPGCKSDAVYPRMRGEHPSWRWQSCSASGLSPHARGTSRAPVS